MRSADDLIDRSVSHTEIVHADYDPTLAVELKLESEGYLAGMDGLEFWGTSEDANEWRVHLTLPSNAVVLEIMPEHLRSSHRAAGNWGRYPDNGAERYAVSPETADEAIEYDEDEYAHVVKADPADYEYRETL